jgi:hypothetical protein
MKRRLTGSIVGLAAAMALAVVGCGGDNGGAIRTVTVPAEQDAQATGDAILIETRISSAANHTGEVLSGSVIGESPFCPGGGTSTGGSEGALITTTFHCRDGLLKVSYSPTQHSLVQGAPWKVVSGTGRYKGLRAGGSMVARFRSDDPQKGGETFAGTVGE